MKTVIAIDPGCLGVVAEQSATNAKLVVCLDNNTKILEECRDELRCSRRRKTK
jgi:hypothetical protein